MKVVLSEPHTHCGTKYPASAELDVPDDAAEWLVKHQIAKKAAASKRTELNEEKQND